MQITVSKLFDNRGKNGKTYWTVLTPDGTRYWVWDRKVAQGLKPGQTYEVQIRDGQFPAITEAAVLQPEPPQPQPPQPAPEPGLAQALTELAEALRSAARCLIYSQALEVAFNFLATKGQDFTPDDIIKIALYLAANGPSGGSGEAR